MSDVQRQFQAVQSNCRLFFKDFLNIKDIKQQLSMVIFDIPTDVLHIIGIVYSALGVALAVISCFFFKIHARALDHIQWGYFLAVIMLQYSVTFPFSLNMEVGSSLVELSSEALQNFYCLLGIYVCQRPFALSFMVILAGFLMLMAIVTIPQRIKDVGITFERVYRLFKGLFKWFYLPLMFQSIYLLLLDVRAQLTPSIIILAVLIIFPFVQVAMYNFFEEDEDPFLKWLELANYFKAGMFPLFAILVLRFNTSSYFYYLSLIFLGYVAFFALKYNFRFAIFSRILYISGEVVFYFLYSLYVAGSTWFTKYYYLDLFGIGIILVLDIVFYVAEGTVVFKEWSQNRRSEIIPQKSLVKKGNRYEQQTVEEMQQNERYFSRDRLDESKKSVSQLENLKIKKSPNKKRRQ